MGADPALHSGTRHGGAGLLHKAEVRCSTAVGGGRQENACQVPSLFWGPDQIAIKAVLMVLREALLGIV